VILVKYDSKRLEREHFLFNIPDNDVDQLADLISRYEGCPLKFYYRDFKGAGIGSRPFVLIAYSMGGVITRHTILKHLGEFENLKGVAFIASPLQGSTMRDQINRDMRQIIPAFNKFLCPME
jgi:alpha-beta hydrolase superfamily lysophospholipase